jgi:hypothetical protein
VLKHEKCIHFDIKGLGKISVLTHVYCCSTYLSHLDTVSSLMGITHISNDVIYIS